MSARSHASPSSRAWSSADSARRLADVDLGRSQPDDRGGDRVEDVVRRHDQQPDRTDASRSASATTCEKSCCSAGVAVVSADSSSSTSDAEQPNGHDDDVAIAGALEGRRDVRQRMRMPHADQDVARSRIDLPQQNVARREQLQRVGLGGLVAGVVPGRHREQDDETEQQPRRGDRRNVCGEEHGDGAAGQHHGHAHQSDRQLAAANAQVERRAERSRSEPHGAQSDERGDLDHQRRGDGDAVGAGQPRDPAAAGDEDDDRRRGGDVDGAREGAKPRMRHRQRFRQGVPGREPPQRLLRVLERLVRGGDQHEKRGDRQQHAEEMSQPVGGGQMCRDTGEGRLDPGVDLRLGDEQDERKGQQRRPGE